MKKSISLTLILLLTFIKLVILASTQEQSDKQKFSEQCISNLFSGKFETKCISIIIAKLIGMAIITLSFTYKVPQIKNVLASKSAQGLSLFSTYIETLLFLNVSLYGLHTKIPFSTFGENIIIFVQNIILQQYLWKFSDKEKLSIKPIVVRAFFLTYFLVLFSDLVLPEIFWNFIPSTTIYLMILSKFGQIKQNFTNKSTGQLAFLTVLMGVGGSLSRVFTTITETNDLGMLVMNFVGFGLNLFVLIQMIMYWNSGSKDQYVKVQPEKKRPSSKAMKKVD